MMWFRGATAILPTRSVETKFFSSSTSNFKTASRIGKGLTYHNRVDQFATVDTIKPNPNAIIRKKQLGRGHASGNGNKSGRGDKGFKARNSKSTPRIDFEGGQTSIIERFPMLGKRKRNNPDYMSLSMDLTKISINQIQNLIENGQLDVNNPITMKELINVESLNIKNGVLLTAKGLDQFNIKNLNIEVTKATKPIIDAIESNNGSIKIRYHSKEILDYYKNPNSYIIPPVDTPPLNPKLIALYTDEDHKGYLANGKDLNEKYANYISQWKEATNKITRQIN